MSLLAIEMVADRLTIVPNPSLLNTHWYDPVKPRLPSTELIYSDPFGNWTLQREPVNPLGHHPQSTSPKSTHLNVSPTMPISCPSGPLHRIFGICMSWLISSSLLACLLNMVPSHGNNTELPSGATTSCGSTWNLSAANNPINILVSIPQHTTRTQSIIETTFRHLPWLHRIAANNNTNTAPMDGLAFVCLAIISLVSRLLRQNHH